MILRLGAPALGALLIAPALAWAEDPAAPPPAVTVAATIDAASDYRFRGVSQSDRKPAIQGGVTISHASGFYVGTWGSTLAGWGRIGGATLEVDAIGGFRKSFGGATVDVGLLWYLYPGAAAKADFAEPYVHVSGIAGPVTLTATVAYAPPQQALGRWYTNGAAAAAGVYSQPGATHDNLYVAGDAAAAIPRTPFTLKAHVGRSHGQAGLGPNATALSPTGTYWDWSLGVDTSYRNLTLTLAYVDTDIRTGSAAWRRLQPAFSKGQDGSGSIAAATLLVMLAAAF